MRKVLHIAFWILGIAGFMFLVAFEQVSEEQTLIKTVTIELIQHDNQLFLNKQDVIELIDKQDDSLLFRSVNTINTAMLEESLENHPFIADAEVFSTLDGLLSVQVEQKLAIARVIDNNQHYYLDAEGHPFPVTKAYSATVPVFTGLQDSASLYNALQLLKTVQATNYFSSWLAEIHTTSSREIELIPVNGNHRVLFGTPELSTEKLKKLKGFYSTVVTEENLNEWKTLNVAYDKLLVSTKY
jgi:cell division protein FtsQ